MFAMVWCHEGKSLKILCCFDIDPRILFCVLPAATGCSIMPDRRPLMGYDHTAVQLC